MISKEIDIVPLAAESLGVRSLATYVKTPHIRILLDPSAALGIRHSLDPHPLEYAALSKALKLIYGYAEDTDVISLSHYHYDHIRPGLTNWHLNFSRKETMIELYDEKMILMKDGRDSINPSQRRRAYYFQRDLKGTTAKLVPADNLSFTFGDTLVSLTPPFPHGPDDTPLGYVIGTKIEHDETKILFMPDVQGPCSQGTLDYILAESPDLLILGGPPTYLNVFSPTSRNFAFSALRQITKLVPHTLLDHHLIRSQEWKQWLTPVLLDAQKECNIVETFASYLGIQSEAQESMRKKLYQTNTPSESFIQWSNATSEYKMLNPPPIKGVFSLGSSS